MPRKILATRVCESLLDMVTRDNFSHRQIVEEANHQKFHVSCFRSLTQPFQEQCIVAHKAFTFELLPHEVTHYRTSNGKSHTHG
eukprot:1084053-Amphidinium_carterae.1